MPKKGARTRVASGIYLDKYGYEAIVGRTKHFPQASQRFPPDTPLAKMQRWQLNVRSARLTERPDSTQARNTLAADIPAYLKTLAKDARTWPNILLRHWLNSPLAAQRRHEITRGDVKAQLAAWTDAGAAASTVNHRLRALRALYHELDGKDAPNPTTGIQKQREPDAEPRAVHPAVAFAILEQLRPIGKKGAKRDSATKIRLRVMVTTGLPHSQLMRLARRDVDFTKGVFYARPRRKGKGAPGAWLPLLPQAVDALKAYDAAKLWETSFSRDSMRRSFRLAVEKVVQAADASGVALHLPPKLRPYDLRHSFLTAAYLATGDLRAVQALAQHSDIKTTRRYTEGAVDARAALAIQELAKRW